MMKQRANMIQWITTRVGIWSLDSFKFASKSLPMAWTHQCPSLIAAPSFLICVKEVNSSSSVISEAEFQFCTPQFSSFTQSCPTLCDPKDCSTRGFSVHHQLLELTQTLMSIELVMPYNHLVLCYPLILLPSIFHRIRVFSNVYLRKVWNILSNFL